MTIDEARAAIEAGAEYGSVYEEIAESQRSALADWFCHTPGVPNLAARAARAAVPAPASPVPTGDACTRCGGLMVRTGMCMTCQSCGESSGGCG